MAFFKLAAAAGICEDVGVNIKSRQLMLQIFLNLISLMPQVSVVILDEAGGPLIPSAHFHWKAHLHPRYLLMHAII